VHFGHLLSILFLFHPVENPSIYCVDEVKNVRSLLRVGVQSPAPCEALLLSGPALSNGVYLNRQEGGGKVPKYFGNNFPIFPSLTFMCLVDPPNLTDLPF
jgi:hypothetical protein